MDSIEFDYGVAKSTDLLKDSLADIEESKASLNSLLTENNNILSTLHISNEKTVELMLTINGNLSEHHNATKLNWEDNQKYQEFMVTVVNLLPEKIQSLSSIKDIIAYNTEEIIALIEKLPRKQKENAEELFSEQVEINEKYWRK